MITSRHGQFYEVGIQYNKTQKDGQQKKVTEKYVFDAQSFTEAEARAVDVITPYISSDYNIKSETLANYANVILSDAQNAVTFYKVKVGIYNLSEKTGKERWYKLDYLVQAIDINNAIDNMTEFFKDWIQECKIVSIAETRVQYFFDSTDTTTNA